ncbi:MAG: pilus assembly FimT family protein [Verrucomicrobiales bacterium]
MRLHASHISLLKLKRRAKRSGFTLVEIMIVVAIIAVILTTSIPMVWKALNKNELAKAVNDITEGCKAARDRAILQGIPYAFVIHNEGGLDVEPMPPQTREGASSQGSGGTSAKSVHSAGSLMGAFPRKLGENVIVQLIDVNFVDHMQAPEARVRFFPNGTSDEFTIVLNDKGAQRTITLDIITALPYEITP